MLNEIKSFVKHSKHYWQFREKFNKNIWNGYFEDWRTKRRDFYSNFATDKEIKSVYEFGCASGPNLANIYFKSPTIPLLFGCDINKSALKLGKSRLKGNVVLSEDISGHAAINALKVNSLEKYDLAIFDRVLYLLSDKQLNSQVAFCKQYARFVIIDDFMHNTALFNQDHPVKNYPEIFVKSGFEIIDFDKSEHLTGSEFSELFAKRLVLRNQFI